MSGQEISDLQKKRAVNIIWNSAGNYSFTPDFKAYDEDGNAELYFNSIIGAVRKHYDYPEIEKLFRAVAKYEDSDVYESLLWLALENAVFGREEPERPVLASLRISYAEKWLNSVPPSDDYMIFEHISRAHFEKVLGKDPKLNSYDAALLEEIEFSPELDTMQIVGKAKQLLEKWFMINTREKKGGKLAGLLKGFRKNGKAKSKHHRFGHMFTEHPDYESNDPAIIEAARQNGVHTSLSEKELREFIRFKFGRPIYDPATERELEKQICTGDHALCRLHFTAGEEYDGEIQNAFEALQKQKESRQKQKNREYYAANRASNRTAVSRLSDRIRNCILLYLQADDIKSDSGKLTGGKVWRAERLGDGRVFKRREREAAGDLSVDILLDASTSQIKRQETVSSQGFIIAESLNRCGVPCRVSSFCSMTGYTVINIFREYTETSRNSRIFDYVSTGCNRDGLAIKALHELMMRSRYEHRILIILSDVKPNDVCRIPGDGDEQFLDYNGDRGVADTAAEVRKARADGISVICVFTGADEDLPSARLIYGSDFARIQSVDMLAETVGNLLLNCIRNL
ncbi:MAG: hypothetical protein IJJ22_02605 [Oscillospiraceae bacterium]|nr:hypothetical protein [Oscillospiraceae bacterium]